MKIENQYRKKGKIKKKRILKHEKKRGEVIIIPLNIYIKHEKQSCFIQKEIFEVYSSSSWSIQTIKENGFGDNFDMLLSTTPKDCVLWLQTKEEVEGVDLVMILAGCGCWVFGWRRSSLPFGVWRGRMVGLGGDFCGCGRG